jgi:hypothetical protein
MVARGVRAAMRVIDRPTASADPFARLDGTHIIYDVGSQRSLPGT